MAFTQVIKTLGSVMEGMKTAVNTWLSQNITNPSNPPLDRSLSLSNACAPADLVGDLKKEIGEGFTEFPVTTNGSFGGSGPTTGTANRIRTDLIPFTAGDIITIENGSLRHACGMWQGSVSSSTNTRNDNAFVLSNEVIRTTYDGFIVIVFRNADNSSLSPSDFDGHIKRYTNLTYSLLETEPFFKTDTVTFVSGYYYNTTNHQLQTDADYSYVKLNVSLFKGGKISGTTSTAPNSSYGVAFVDKSETFISGYTNTSTGSYIFGYNLDIPMNAEWIYISCRNEGIESTWVDPAYTWNVVLDNIASGNIDVSGVINSFVEHKLYNARHVKTGANKPLTLMHFSDIHADAEAMNRMLNDATKYASLIDEYICTGDMVNNTYGSISSWWNAKVLTCIGNHDTASYSEGSYNWTALSMADRDTYYISPFEGGWGISHTSGTSYYYKDYSEQKLRLIVMDAMLYTNAGAEATTQTAWLSDLLSSAITNNMHVLIAIHSPHGGATPLDCSFTEYGQGTMPTYSDCNTPQAVIDAVATAITNGLHFIGYLCGHTHHDVVWDAEGDGKQLMYCITCGCTNNVNQWRNADLYRGIGYDAYNIVSIDTSRTLIKIIRGGGADIDDHMRTREAICFNYSTGQKVGEVL